MFSNDLSHSEEIYSLLEMKLGTGKKHQLRLMCSNVLLSPVLGDYKYGFEDAPDLFRRSMKYTALQERRLLKDKIMLHSRKIEVPVKPETGSRKEFEAEYPEQMASLMEQLN